MEKVKELSPEQLEVKSGGGCLSIFGLPFLAAGIFVTLVAFGVIVPTNADEIPVWGWFLMACMGLAFVAVGGGLAFGRQWKIIDRSRGMITVNWGLLVPMKSTDYGLYEYDAVVLTHQPGDSETRESFPVALRGIGSRSEFKIVSPGSYAQSRMEAEKIAKFLRLPLVDRSTPHESVLEAEASQRSFGKRNGNGSATTETVSPPAVMRSVVQESTDSTTITIPGRFGPAVVIQFLVPVAFAIFVLFNVAPFFRATNTPAAVSIFFIGIALLFVVVPLVKAVAALVGAKTRATVVTSSRRGIDIEERQTFRRRAIEIPADAILDVDFSTTQTVIEAASASNAPDGAPVPGSGRWKGGQTVSIPSWHQKLLRLFPARGIFVKARTGIFTFGTGLPDDEVRYLHYMVTKAIAPGAQQGRAGSVPVSDIIGSGNW